jgi:hypothetical protein
MVICTKLSEYLCEQYIIVIKLKKIIILVGGKGEIFSLRQKQPMQTSAKIIVDLEEHTSSSGSNFDGKEI